MGTMISDYLFNLIAVFNDLVVFIDKSSNYL